jgi:hypothetical protein
LTCPSIGVAPSFKYYYFLKECCLAKIKKCILYLIF